MLVKCKRTFRCVFLQQKLLDSLLRFRGASGHKSLNSPHYSFNKILFDALGTNYFRPASFSFLIPIIML